MGNFDNDYERTVIELENLGVQISKNDREIRINFVVDIREARWFSSMIYEEVEKGLLSAELKVNKSKHSMDIEAILRIVEGVAIVVAGQLTNFLLKQLKNYLRRKKKKEEKRRGHKIKN